MPRLLTCSAIRILTFLLLNFSVTENIKYLDFQGRRLPYDPCKSFWSRRLFYKIDLMETIGIKSVNETSRFGNDQIVKNASIKKEYEDTMKNIKKRTLMNYNGPAIMEDLDSKNDQNLVNHVRVKRSEPMNNSFIYRQWKSSTNLDDSFQNCWDKNDAMYAFDEPMSKLEESYPNSDHTNESSIHDEIAKRHSRRKREVMSKNGKYKKRMKRNAEYSRHSIRAQIWNKKYAGTLKAPNKSATKKTNGSGKKKKKVAIETTTKTISESQIESRKERRESENGSLNANITRGTVSVDFIDQTKALIDQKDSISLISNKSFDKQSRGNTIVLPFGKAEMRVRIEKLLPNDFSFIIPDSGMNRSAVFDSFPTVLPKYDRTIGETININITNSVSAPTFESTERKEGNNSTMETALKRVNYGTNAFDQETSDSGNMLFYNEESPLIESNSPETFKRDQNSKHGKYDHASKIFAKTVDAKSRAKRNQEITSKRYLRNHINATGAKRVKQGKARGNRATRSVEEIKDLAEKLITKVKELEIYMSNHSETLRKTDFCVNKNMDRVGIEEILRRFSKSKSKSKLAGNAIDKCRHLVKNNTEGSLVEKRISQVPSSTSRFVRGSNRSRRIPRRKWGKWTEWSSCSITCGKGRQIRWRHCLRDCDDAETEMEEKTCQLPACPPGKFLGIF